MLPFKQLYLTMHAQIMFSMIFCLLQPMTI